MAMARDVSSLVLTLGNLATADSQRVSEEERLNLQPLELGDSGKH